MNITNYTLPEGAPTAWYPKPETLPGCLSEIAEMVGVPVALAFGAAYGGQRKYIPNAETISPDHWLAKAIGYEAALIFAGRHAREMLDVRAGANERRVIAVLRLFYAGYSINRIVSEVGVSRRHVRRITNGLEKPPVSVSPKAELEACPACGRQLRRSVRKRDADARQLVLPLASREPLAG